MRYLTIIGAALLAGCAQSEQVDEFNQVNYDPESIAAAAENAAQRNGQTTADPVVGGPNQWFSKTNQEGPWAGYGPPNSEAVFSARCESGVLHFNTTELPRSGAGETTMTVAAQGVDETIPAQASEQGLPHTEATVPADAAWLQRLTSASGNLTVRVAESEPIVVPISQPLTSLIRDCARRGTESSSAGGQTTR